MILTTTQKWTWYVHVRQAIPNFAELDKPNPELDFKKVKHIRLDRTATIATVNFKHTTRGDLEITPEQHSYFKSTFDTICIKVPSHYVGAGDDGIHLSTDDAYVNPKQIMGYRVVRTKQPAIRIIFKDHDHINYVFPNPESLTGFITELKAAGCIDAHIIDLKTGQQRIKAN